MSRWKCGHNSNADWRVPQQSRGFWNNAARIRQESGKNPARILIVFILFITISWLNHISAAKGGCNRKLSSGDSSFLMRNDYTVSRLSLPPLPLAPPPPRSSTPSPASSASYSSTTTTCWSSVASQPQEPVDFRHCCSAAPRQLNWEIESNSSFRVWWWLCLSGKSPR